MCMIRDNDDNCNRILYPLQILDTIDLTLDEFGDDDEYVEVTHHGDLWNYPYNLLPSSDEEELARSFTEHEEDNNGDVHYAGSSTTVDSSNEINQNANRPSAFATINIAGANDNGEGRSFELNIPQILLSMYRISNNLSNQTSESHD